MRILVCLSPRDDSPYSHRADETLDWFQTNYAALKETGFDLELRESRGWALFEAALKEYWEVGADFINVEQDVVPDMDSLIQLANCRESPICLVRFDWHHTFNPPSTRLHHASCHTGHCNPTDGCFIVNEKGVVAPAPPGSAFVQMTGLGCIRFRGDYIRQHPWDMEGIPVNLDGRNIDWRLWTMLGKRRGTGQLTHLHSVPSRPTGMLKHNHTPCTGRPEDQ